MAELIIYTTPKEARVVLAPDNGMTIQGQPTVHNGRDDAKSIQIPFETGGIGARMNIECDGYVPIEYRGILKSTETEASYTLDDVHMQLTPSAPPPDPGPPPDPTYPKDPEGIINYVYSTGNYDLTTKAGCGIFTEDCCTALHENLSPYWGHIRKNPGQNQFNGHAVDAVQCAAGVNNGIWDIIYNSESSAATPQYIYKEPPNLEIWYYPAAPLTPPALNVIVPKRGDVGGRKYQ